MRSFVRLFQPLWSQWLWLLVIGVGLGVLAHTSSPLLAAESCEQIQCSHDNQSEDQYLTCNRNKQACWEEKIKETRNSAITLSNTLNLLNGQLAVQQLQIEQTLAEISKLNREIDDLTKRIAGLNVSLDRLTTILVERVQAQYKRNQLSPLVSFVTTTTFSHALTQAKYIALAQEQTATAMQQAEQQKQTYDQQKILKEAKQDEVEKKKQQLESQRSQLTKQKSEQQFLLQETKNNEARYQQELQKTLAELEAIQAIIAGNGNENKVKDVSQGDTIASIIVGASPCSTGTHLHFEVVKDGSHRDPAGYLKPIDVIWSNQPDNSFGFGGDWDWPLNNPARINQGYGMTYYARVRRSYGGAPHTGIDLVSKTSGDNAVKAVKSGELYRGSISCGGGQLRYVKVVHKDSGVQTYYLHVNY